MFTLMDVKALSYIQGILDKMLQGSSKEEGGLDLGFGFTNNYNTLRKLG